jgi:hypothetical protein
MSAVVLVDDDAEELVEPKTWWLDVAPLVEFVNGRGGITTVLPKDSPLFVRFSRVWTRAVRRGLITERCADEFCVRVLHVPPSSVWGDEIWRNHPPVRNGGRP